MDHKTDKGMAKFLAFYQTALQKNKATKGVNKNESIIKSGGWGVYFK